MKEFRTWTTVVAFIVVMIVGICCGWFARAQTPASALSRQGAIPGVEHEKERAEEPFSPQALQNMGVRWEPAVKNDFTVCREILATIRELPTALRPVTARWGGTVSKILSSGTTDPLPTPTMIVGRTVKPEEPLLEMIRAPLPKIEKSMTGEIMETVSETVHETFVQLRTAIETERIARQEFERVRDLNAAANDGLPLIPRQTEIGLQNELRKAQVETERLEQRLFLHGFSKEQIAAMSAGNPPTLSADVWKRALVRNGLWPKSADRISAQLPEPLRTHPWTFAALGELAAFGKCDESLADAIAAYPNLAVRFQEAAALMLAGHSLEDVVEKARSGALEPLVIVRTPHGAPFWEIREIRVKPGEMVETGAVLVWLADQRRMSLELEVQGADSVLADRAFETGTILEAKPLFPEAGPLLCGFRLKAYAANMDSAEVVPKPYAIVENERFSAPPTADAFPSSAWRLRPGMRYRVLLPVQTFRGVFAFPRTALVSEGPEKVIYLRSGNGFRRQIVHLLHEDREFAVLADDGTVFAGDPVVTSGVFALSLALRAENTNTDTTHAKHGPSCQH